ncbi:MAG TPA: hypothetical protein VGL26_07330 [Jatrophihabitans sp.]|jgi:hypothetical protein
MSRARRAVLVSIAAALAATAAPAYATNTSETSGPGYAYLRSDLLGESPTGMKVLVDKRAGQKHASAIASFAKADVRTMAALHLPITFGGYYTKATTASGSITITESRKGCGAVKGGDRAGLTEAEFTTIPAGASEPAGTAPSWYVDHSVIYLCPDLLTVATPKLSPVQRRLPAKSRAVVLAKLKKKAKAEATKLQKTTVAHELGHAVGLGHTSYKVRGKYQVMYPVANSAPTTYASGDLAGLAALAAGSDAVKRAFPPEGTVGHSGPTGSTLTVTGSAKLKYLPGTSVHVELRVAQVGGSAFSTPTETTADGTFAFNTALLSPACYTVTATSPFGPSTVLGGFSFFDGSGRPPAC